MEREVPATVGQRLLWMMDHYRATAEYGSFNCPVLCRLRGRLDTGALTRAVHELERRHETLRTVLSGRGRDLRQRVYPPRAAPITWHDVSTEPDPRSTVDEQVARELRTHIDVTEWPSRVTGWRTGPTDHILCLNLHHVVTDAWSTGVLFRELQALYAGRSLPPVPLQYADFAAREDSLDRERAYWLRQLDGSRLACPPRRPDASAAASGPTGTASVALPPRAAERLRDKAKQHRTTLFAVLLAGYFAALHRATGAPDLTVASLFANRMSDDTHGTVGFLANMVMLRCREAGTDLDALIAATHRTSVEAMAHQRQPFQLLPPHLVDTQGMRADDMVFQMVTDPQHRGHAGGVEFELLVPESIGSRFSFELAVTPVGAGLRAVLFYRRDWFDSAWAEDFVGGYGELVQAAATASGTRA